MRKIKQEKLIEYEIVKRASEGDVDAINLVDVYKRQFHFFWHFLFNI